MTGSASTLDIFKVTQCDRTFPRVYYSREGDVERGERVSERERENFKVQKLFADVQIRSKSLREPEGAQMLFD